MYQLIENKVEPWNYTISSTMASLTETEKEIHSFANLSEGWNYGQGEPAKCETIEKAILINSIGTRLGLNSEANPLTDGSISLTFYIEGEDHFIDIIIKNHEPSFAYKYEIGKGIEYKIAERINPITFELIYKKLKKLSPWRLSEHYILDITNPQKRGSLKNVSQTIKGASQYLSMIVPSTQA